MIKHLPLLLPALSGLLLLNACSTDVTVRQPTRDRVVVVHDRPQPPPPRYEAEPPPYQRARWIKGHYQWNGREYVWVRGHYRPA